MANTKKRKATTKKPASTSRNKKQTHVKDNVYALILAVVSVLLILSLVTDLIGPVGKFLKDVTLGLLGPSAFLIPIFFVYISFMLVVTNKKLTTSGIFGGVFILMFSAFYNLFVFTAPAQGTTPFSEYLNLITSELYNQGASSISSGGVLGGYLAVPFSSWFGALGAGIIFFAVLAVSFIMTTGIDLKALFTSDGHRVDEPSPDLEKERKRTEKQLEKLTREKEKVEREMEKQLEDIKAKSEEIDHKSAEKRKRFRFFGASKEAESGAALEKELDDIHAPYKEEAENARKARPDLFEEGDEKGFDESIIEGYKQLDAEQDPLLTEVEKLAEKEKIEVNMEEEVSKVEEEINLETAEKLYEFPPIDLLNYVPSVEGTSAYDELKMNAEKLISALRSFNIEARVINVSRGPTVTRYELQPSVGVRVSKIINLADDIALQLAAVGVRIEAPIPGKSAIGIEVPNKANSTVYLRELIESDTFKNSKSALSVALGKDISGENVVADLAKMPHLMIAGATGSGKSVCVNSMLMSLLYHASPDDVKLILVDPKVVELNVYNGLPHLLIPVVTEAKKAAGALGWAVSEMLKRYEKFKEKGVRDFAGFNSSLSEEEKEQKLPQIVIVIDEMADLMMTAPKEVEDAVCRLAQMARAAGMHLVIATQRPSVDVITGTIKANIPSKIAFAVSSATNSRIIIDEGGAEKLVGKGDMLYMPVGCQKPTRVQGCFVSDGEVERVISFIKEHSKEAEYDDSVMQKIAEEERNMENKGSRSKMTDEALEDSGDEAIIKRAIEVVVNEGRASTSVLQRRLSLGYARAARIMDELYERGIIGPYQGSKPREVLLTKQQYLEMLNNQSL